MAGLTEKGWETKTYNEVVSEMKSTATNIFSDLIIDPNDVVDTSDDSTIGRLIGLISPSASNLWDAMADIYLAFDPTAATGLALDNIVSYIGLYRKSASKSTVMAKFSGQDGTTVPLGSVVKNTTTGTSWDLTEDVVFTQSLASGINLTIQENTTGGDYEIRAIAKGDTRSEYISTYTASASETPQQIIEKLSEKVLTHSVFTTNISNGGLTLEINSDDIYQYYEFSVSNNFDKDTILINKTSQIKSQETGVIEGSIGSITTIATPIQGWEAVTNTIPVTLGQDIESDIELRKRFDETKFTTGQASVDSIYSGLVSVSGVKQVRVYENDGDEVNQYGVPPHAFMCIISGGEDKNIASKIWEKKPVSIKSFGEITVEIEDSQGEPHDISFSRPVVVPVYVKMNIEAEKNFSLSNQDEIKSALTNYINNLGIGGNIRFSRLFTPINSVPNFYMEGLVIGTDKENMKSADIISNFNEIFNLSVDDIEIVIL